MAGSSTESLDLGEVMALIGVLAVRMPNHPLLAKLERMAKQLDNDRPNQHIEGAHNA